MRYRFWALVLLLAVPLGVQAQRVPVYVNRSDWAADKLPYMDGTGSADVTTTDITTFGRSLVGAADAATAAELLNLKPDQIVTVAKDGGDFDTIQGAIDSITDAATDKRYTVLIYPGEYAENVVMEEYISLKGVGDHISTTITSASGVTITMPTGTSATTLSDISIESTGDGGTVFLQTTGFCILHNVWISWVNANNGTSGTLCDIRGGVYSQYGGKLRYNGGGSAVGVVTHTAVDMTGSAAIRFYQVHGDMDIEDVDDTFVGFNMDASYTGGFCMESGDYEFDALNVAYSGNFTMWNVAGLPSGTPCARLIDADLNSAGGGTGTLIAVDSPAGGASVIGFGISASITGFTTNYTANVAAGDTITTGSSNITAADGATGAGTLVRNALALNGDLYISSDMHAAYIEFDDAENTYIGLDKVYPTYFAFSNDETNFWLGNASDPNIWMNYEKDADIIVGQGTGGDTDIIISEGSTNKTRLNQSGINFIVDVEVTNGGIDLDPNGTGNVTLGNFVLDGDQTVGAGQDNYVLTYDNGTGLVSLEEVPAETDPIVGAISGLVKADGAGAISAAVADIDYQSALSGATITSATVATDDKVLIQDTNDTDNLKTVTAQSIADLASAGVEVNVETLSGGNKTIADGDPSVQIITPDANRDVYLPASPAADCEFVIVNAAAYDSTYLLEVQISGETQFFTRLYAGGSARFIYDSTDGLWRCIGPGVFTTRTATNAYSNTYYNLSFGREAKCYGAGVAIGPDTQGYTKGVAVGYQANGRDSGIGIGYQASGYDAGVSVGYSSNGTASGTALGYDSEGGTQGAAVGHSCNGSSYGAAVGHSCNGSTYGAAVGYNAAGYSYGVAIGGRSDGVSYGVALGYYADTNINPYAVAIGPYVQADRYGEVATQHTTGTETTTFRKSEVSWYGEIAGGSSSTEVTLRGVAGKYCTVFENSTVNIKGTIVARDATANESNIWEFTYSVSNNAGTTTEKHAPVLTVLSQDDATWAIDFDVVDSTTDYIRPMFTPDGTNSTEVFIYAVITEIIE